MPNPFPGMNPFLERPNLWSDVHNSLIIYLRAQIQQQLPPDYHAKTEDRLYVLTPDPIRPDITLFKRQNLVNQGGIAVLERPQSADAPTILQRWNEEVLVPYIEIVSIRDPNTVVTVIEILSPANKHREGLLSYRSKQQQILRSETHLIEIDLLREGDHTIAAPYAEVMQSQPYKVCLHRAGAAERYEVWMRGLSEPLPRFSIPLREPDEDITADLQTALNRAFEEGGYDRMIDTSDLGTLNLRPDDHRWASNLLGRV
jgi:Protein of unknown function (DUF4058)